MASFQRFAPGTIYLGPQGTERNVVADLAASEAITPGMLVERFANGAVNRVRKSTLTGLASSLFALDHPMANKGIDDAYAAGDLVEILAAKKGDEVYSLLASGAAIAFGAPLSDNGNGYLKAASGVTIAFALEAIVSHVDGTRVRIEVA